MNTFLIILICCSYAQVIVVKAKSLEKRIIGGQMAEQREFRHHATFLVNGRYKCGAALVTFLHLLTTAHCLEQPMSMYPRITDLKVLLGSILLYHGILRRVARLSHHRGFTKDGPFLYPNNIGVIHLTNAVPLNGPAFPVGIPSLNSIISDNVHVVVSGFGFNSTIGPLSPVLLAINLTTANLAECQHWFPNRRLHPFQLCTLSPGQGYGMATGDHGNPMVYSGSRIIFGIVSSHAGEIGNGGPDIYTQISPFLDYVMRELSLHRRRFEEPSIHPFVNF